MFLFYADESGVPTYANTDKEPLFVLTAVAVHEGKWHAIEDSLTGIKKQFFPRLRPERVEFKGRTFKSALAGKPPKWSPLSTLSPDRIRALIKDVFEALDPTLFQTFAVAVDKQAVRGRYETPWHVYDIAYGILAQKLTEFLSTIPAPESGLVLLDKQSEVERRILNLRRAAETLASRAIRPVDLDRLIEKPLFVDSRQHHGIQLADICAHIIYQVIMREDFGSEYFRKVEECFARDGKDDRYYRYGFQGFPEYITPPYQLTGVKVGRWGPLTRR